MEVFQREEPRAGCEFGLIRHVGDALAKFRTFHEQIPTLEPDLSRIQVDEAEDGLDEGGLPRAIGADEAHEGAAPKGEAGAVQMETLKTFGEGAKR